MSEPDAHDPNRLRKADFEQLEVIRGIAALVVVLNHARGWLWAGGQAVSSSGAAASYGPVEWLFFYGNFFTRCGHEAVILFFVLSGFSIAHSLRVRPDGSRPAIGEFFKRRAVRLYPPYLAGLAWATVVALSVPLVLDVSPPELTLAASARELESLGTVRGLLGALFYDPQLPFVPQYWSLAYEVVFYGIAPWALQRARGYVAVSLALGVAGVVLLERVLPEMFWSSYLFRYNLYFALGVLLYRRHRDVWRWASRPPIWVLYGAVVGGYAVMAFLNYRLGKGWASEAVAVVLAAVSIPLVLRARLRSQVLLWLGRQSYSLYVSHVATVALTLAVLVGVLGVSYPITSPYLWVIAVPPALIVSYCFYLIVERMTRQWLEAARQRRSAVVVASSSAPPRPAETTVRSAD